ncbi:MAG: ABC transporter permease [Pseudomonadales bacterium]|nr:ABC transporter permease [Pseudomonadales bacterium]
MRLLDIILFTGQTLGRHRFRSAMTLVSMAIGVAAVLTLTGLGEGARGYVLGQFSFLGTDTLIMFPGRKETTGGMPPVTGSAARNITLEDTQTMARLARGVDQIAPLVVGSAPISYESRSREAVTVGTTAAFFSIRGIKMKRGKSLPDIPMEQAKNICIIGETIKTELFGNLPAVGQWLRVSDRRCRIIGLTEGRGDAFGMDLSDAVFIPVASAQSLFDTEALFRVFFKIKANASLAQVEKQLINIMRDRHQGELDVTLVRPDAMISTFNDLLLMLTFAIVGIASISLLVAGILIMNITLISVNQRTSEIGLLKAIGAPAGQIRMLFLTEALLLALIGAVGGVIIGETLIFAGTKFFPDIPFYTPYWAILSALGVAFLTSAVFAYLPANRAAKLEPVIALTAK